MQICDLIQVIGIMKKFDLNIKPQFDPRDIKMITIYVNKNLSYTELDQLMNEIIMEKINFSENIRLIDLGNK